MRICENDGIDYRIIITSGIKLVNSKPVQSYEKRSVA